MEKTPQVDRIETALAKVIINKPFYGSILISLKLKEQSPEEMPMPTMGTDGRHLFYANEFVDKCSDEELQAVLVHEAGHIAALHPLRREERQMEPWNVAADMEVNLNCEKEGLKLPQGSVPGKEGTAEEHYSNFKIVSVSCPCGCGGKSKKKSPGEDSDGDGQGKGSHKGWQCQHYDAEAKPGETQAELEAEMTENVRKAYTYAKMCGRVPAGLERMLEEMLYPKLKWDEVLRRFVETKMEPFLDWSSPNRRFLHRNVILPGTGQKRRVAEIIWAVDTSGSVGNTELVAAVSEVRGCLEDCYPQDTVLPLIWFDAAAYLDYISRDDDVRPKGGGGTDFSVVMQCAKDERLTEKCKGMVVITDGYCGTFGEDPGVPVLWLVYGELGKEGKFQPPFGDVISLPLD